MANTISFCIVIVIFINNRNGDSKVGARRQKSLTHWALNSWSSRKSSIGDILKNKVLLEITLVGKVQKLALDPNAAAFQKIEKSLAKQSRLSIQPER